MADRKISELSTASRVFDADYMVVVTGVNQLVPGQEDVYVEKVTTKFPLSGLSTWVFRINEVVSGCTGIQIVPQINTGVGTGKPNTISICTTGVSYVGHTHTSSDITNFGSAVSGLMQQQLKFLSTETANSTAGTFQTLSGLSIDVANNSKYICELGLIMSGISSTQITGLISSTGIAASNNNLLTVYGTWNYVQDSGLYNSSSSVTGTNGGRIASNLTSTQTVINKFTVSTYATESDRLNIQFTANDTNGKVLAGSWFKVEKVI
jgi:hypothetical protein